MAKVTINDLLEAGVHFGHPTRRWNPKMKPYIYGARNGIYIFDLTKTMVKLAEACAFVHDLVANGGNVLFCATKRQAQEVVREVAENCGMPFMCERWLGGTLTNYRTIRKSISRMQSMRERIAKDELKAIPKKEAASIRRELEKLERSFCGIEKMEGMPDALVVVDIEREDIAVREANRLGIPVVAIVDTNCNPDNIDYVIPSNDDALRAIKVIIETLGQSVAEAKQVHAKHNQEAAEAKRQAAEAKAEAKAEGSRAKDQDAQEAKAAKEAKAAAEAPVVPAVPEAALASLASEMAAAPAATEAAPAEAAAAPAAEKPRRPRKPRKTTAGETDEKPQA